MAAVVVEGLRKTYGELVAVDGLSFTIDEGEVFALVGPNGTGKTTTVEILEGHRHRTAGTVRVLGQGPQTGGRALRERIGIVVGGRLVALGTPAELGAGQRTSVVSFRPPAGLEPTDLRSRLHLGALVVWLVGASLVAVRYFRWEAP